MSMFCYQCQETAKNEGCTIVGVCGKKDDVANLQDLLVFILRGIAAVSTCTKQESNPEVGRFMCRAFFATITNTNFDAKAIENLITEGIQLREKIKSSIEKLC